MIQKELNWNIKKWNLRFPKKFYYPIYNKYLSKSKLHLDFGCGFGTLTAKLADKFPKTRFIGIDIEKEEIELGKQKFKNSNLELKCVKNFKNNYDTITCHYVLHHIKKYKVTLKKLFNSLNKNGIIIIHEFNKGNNQFLEKSYQKKIELKLELPLFKEYLQEHTRWSKDEFQKTMELVGFKTIFIKPIDPIHFLYVGKRL